MDRRDFIVWLLRKLGEIKDELVLKAVQSASPVDIGELKGVLRVISMLDELLNSQEED